MSLPVWLTRQEIQAAIEGIRHAPDHNINEKSGVIAKLESALDQEPPKDDMTYAIRRQMDHAAAPRAIDRRGVNGHVLALLRAYESDEDKARRWLAEHGIESDKIKTYGRDGQLWWVPDADPKEGKP